MSRIAAVTALTAVAAVAGVTASVSAAATPKGVGTVLRPTGLSGLTLGTPIADLPDDLHRPSAASGLRKGPLGSMQISTYRQYGLEIGSMLPAAVGDGDGEFVISAVTVKTKAYSVAGSGLKVGATSAGVQKAYPAATCTAASCTVSRGTASEFVFDLKGGKVTAISAIATA